MISLELRSFNSYCYVKFDVLSIKCQKYFYAMSVFISLREIISPQHFTLHLMTAAAAEEKGQENQS